MAQETYAAVLRLVNPEVNKGFAVSFTFPNTNKPTEFVWNKANNFEAEIPTKTTYINDFKQKVVFHTNFAKDVLENYGVHGKGKVKVLEFVKECKRDEYVQQDFPVSQKVEPSVKASVPETKETKKEGKEK